MTTVKPNPAKPNQANIEATTCLCEWGTSRAVRIPKRMCETVGIDIGSDLEMRSGVDEQGSFILIRAANLHRSYSTAPYLSMDDVFDTYEGSYTPTEFDWGDDVGAEVVL